MYTIVGLGNPGDEYTETRHNTGRMALQALAKADIRGVKLKALDTFMNKSGGSVAKLIKSKKSAEKLVIIHDDLDLPLGTIKMCFDRGSGGHKGVESIIRALKTHAFIRIRIGIGKKADIESHVLGKFTPREKEIMKKVMKRVVEAVETLVEKDLQAAMTVANQK